MNTLTLVSDKTRQRNSVIAKSEAMWPHRDRAKQRKGTNKGGDKQERVIIQKSHDGRYSGQEGENKGTEC